MCQIFVCSLWGATALLLSVGCGPGQESDSSSPEQEVRRQNGHLLTGRGLLFLQQGRPTRALTVSKEAQQLIPEAPAPYLNMGLAYSRLGRHAEAIEAFELARALGPANATQFFALGLSLRAQARDQEPPIEPTSTMRWVKCSGP